MIRMPYQKKLKVPVTFPLPLSRSRDYNAIEELFYTIFNFFYDESYESKNIHNPYRCKADLLPMLADFYRYSYTGVKSVEMERDIIATVPLLHHYKGCSQGIDNALELSKVDKTSQIRIPWFYQKEENRVIVVLGRDIQVYKILELLKLVLPLGTKVVIKPGYFVHAVDEVQMHSWTEFTCGPLTPDKQYYIQPNNFWYTTWDPEEMLYHTYVDTQWALGDPTNHDPHGLGRDGATRVGGTETASNDITPPAGKPPEPENITDSYVPYAKDKVKPEKPTPENPGNGRYDGN